VSVCLSVCNTIDNFRKLRRRKLIFAHPLAFISRECESSSYMKVIGSRSRSQEQKRQKSQFCLSVCMYVCMCVCQTTFESRTKYKYLHIRCISRQCGSSSYMKVIGLGLGQGHRTEKGPYQPHTQRMPASGRIRFSAQCKNSIANNSASITHREVKCACGIRFSPTADQNGVTAIFLT